MARVRPSTPRVPGRGRAWRATRLGLAALVLLAACDETVQLLAPEAPECQVCDAAGQCAPAADGTPCSIGICAAGTCVDDSDPEVDVCASSERFVSVAAGEGHTCAIALSGALYCWGQNLLGQLGAGDVAPRLTPALVPGAADWEAIAAGWDHTCGRRRDSTAWCWGYNSEGQLGIGGDEVAGEVITSPTQLAAPPAAWAQLAGGGSHTCGLEGSGGGLWCWGENEHGELGLNSVIEEISTPTRIAEPAADWRQVSTGEYHTCSVDWDGRLFCWGSNENSALGLDGVSVQRLPALISDAQTFARVTSGGRHNCAQDTGGATYCWGFNDDGQLGTGSSAEEVRTLARIDPDPGLAALALGERHGCGIAGDGTLWCWGSNDEGQLGLGARARRRGPPRVGTASDWLAIASGRRHTCAVRANGQLFCWGDNLGGQLGLGDTASRPLPSRVCP
jgi:alpha-tubulin suppressor-like RCC1 family protein